MDDRSIAQNKVILEKYYQMNRRGVQNSGGMYATTYEKVLELIEEGTVGRQIPFLSHGSQSCKRICNLALDMGLQGGLHKIADLLREENLQ
jgi:hypothetical protein